MTPCDLCELHKTCLTVLMSPLCPDRPRFAIYGEAPGAEEDKEGEPFVGASGRLLWDSLKDHGLSREEAFVSNVVKCRPPNNRTPKAKEIKACSIYLDAELEWLKYETDCRVILALGSTAFKALGGQGSITQAQGIPYEYEGMTVVPVLHPSAALRSPRFMEQFRVGIAAFARAVLGEGQEHETEAVLIG